MSRAFTKEIDDAPPPPIPERPISDAPNLVTPRGAALIAAELDSLDAAIAAGGDLEALQREQRYWAARRSTVQVVPSNPKPEVVGFGTTVTVLRRGKTQHFTIVGEDEADPARGLIAWTSPLAKALDGAEAGEAIPFGADEEITIVAIGPYEG